MTSMYEMIMDLPLFKGVSKEHVSSFLEKTHVGFSNYQCGGVLAEPTDEVSRVRFIISGEVNLIHPLEQVGVTVSERTGFGKVLGADRLFGLAKEYPYKAVAVKKTSVMEFSKEQYVNLLHSDSIYMLNFFNYLSLRAQRSVDSLRRYSHGSVCSRLCQLVCVMTDPGAKGIVIDGSEDALADYCSCDNNDIRRFKAQLQTLGIADCDFTTIKIASRLSFLELGDR